MRYDKKIITLILSFIMMITLFPAASFADEEIISDDEQSKVLTSESSAEGSTIDESTDPAYSEELAPDKSEAGEVDENNAKSDEEVQDEAAESVEDEDYDESDLGYEELSFSEGIDQEELGNTDAEQMLEDFFYDGTDASYDGMPVLNLQSVKGDRLTGNNLKYYNNLKTIISEVSTGKRTNTTKKISVASFLGKRKFTAKELGVKRIGYKKNGKWYLDSKALAKIKALLGAESWVKAWTSVLSDCSSDGYWVDWWASQDWYKWNFPFNFNAKSVTFIKGGSITFSIPVMPEFAKDANSSSKYVYIVDSGKIAATYTARENAKALVKAVDDAVPTLRDSNGYTSDQIDYLRLYYYCDRIAAMTDYDHDSAVMEKAYWTGPWSMIGVFDGNSSTKTVCAGYARAFKYLCDMSSFESDWIDCQIVQGTVGGSHMWNIVRMNDGLNYLVDPTWMDGSTLDDKWFLRGAPAGTADSYTIEGSTRVYNDWTKAAFEPAERILSKKNYYEFCSDTAISLKGTAVKKLKKGKKSFKVTWNKVAAPLGALYVDGYQIQYGFKKNFKGAKTMTIKGYAKSSATVKKLKSKKKYYVRIRTYAKLGKKTYYSAWSAKKKVKTK